MNVSVIWWKSYFHLGHRTDILVNRLKTIFDFFVVDILHPIMPQSCSPKNLPETSAPPDDIFDKVSITSLIAGYDKVTVEMILKNML